MSHFSASISAKVALLNIKQVLDKNAHIFPKRKQLLSKKCNFTLDQYYGDQTLHMPE